MDVNQKYPSVTQVLKKYQDFSMINPDVLETAASRGTAVHASCAAYANKKFIPCSDKKHTGYVKSFMTWFDQMVIDVHLVETRLTDENFGFTGCPDLVATLKGDGLPTLIDNKTPATFHSIWGGQMAAYMLLCRRRAKLFVHRCITLRLKPNGKMPIVDSYTESARDLQAFLSALYAHKYFIG